MAALAFCVCSVIQDFRNFSAVFIRCGYSLNKSLSYLRTINRFKLFQKYCAEFWQQYEYETFNSLEFTNKHLNKVKMRRNMRPPQNAAIDFAAIEATAMAMEAWDGNLIESSDSRCRAIENNEIDTSENRNQQGGYDIFDNYDDIEVVDGVELNVSYYEYIDAHPQATETIHQELKEGVSFIVTGHILLTCERFSINFLIDNPTKDIALHINPRLPQNYIVRNTRVRNLWGREEIATQLPFNLQRGKEFSIQVLITESAFLISSNGYHFADFQHRLPLRAIKSIEVKGDVDNVEIARLDVTSYPERQPQSTRKIRRSLLEQPFGETTDGTLANIAFYKVLVPNVVIPSQWRNALTKRQIDDKVLDLPYIGRIERNSLIEGCALCITGRIKLLPHSFYINLQDGPNIWPHQNIAFHFNPRFSTRGSGTLGKAIVCRNAWYNGAWAKEERSELDTNLRPGKKFVLMIRCTKNAFIVYVDRKLITSFQYQLEPSIVNTIYIRGDIKLIDVTVMSAHTGDPSYSESSSYANEDEEYLDDTKIGAHIATKELHHNL